MPPANKDTTTLEFKFGDYTHVFEDVKGDREPFKFRPYGGNLEIWHIKGNIEPTQDKEPDAQ